MNELEKWLCANKIAYKRIDNELIDITDFGKVFVPDMSCARSIFRGDKEHLTFNLMEDENVLFDEGIYYAAFEFGHNWYYTDLREDFEFNILKYVGKRMPTQKDIPFVNLGIHSPYELLNGSGDLSVWVKKACYLGHAAIGICDRNTMAGTLALQKACSKAGIKHVFGYSFTLDTGMDRVDMKIYCQTQKGLQNLLRIQKVIMVDSKEHVISPEDLLIYAEGNVLVLGTLSSYWMVHHTFLLDEFKKRFDDVYYQVDLSEYKAERIDIEYLKAIRHFFHSFHLPHLGEHVFAVKPILICDTYYPDHDECKNKTILNKIALGAAHNQSSDQYYKDTDELYAVFSSLFDSEKWDVPGLFEMMCRHTVDIANHATAAFELGKMFMPQYIMRDEEVKQYGDRRKMFHALLDEGLMNKVPCVLHDAYKKRLQEEVYIIESTNNVDYFLIQWDMVSEAHKRGILTGVGRGSAGGSLVSYLLGITTIDPIKYELLFSRFLVPERCGLHWEDCVSVLGQDRKVKQGGKLVRVTLPTGSYAFLNDAEFAIERGGQFRIVYADELQAGDEIIFDNRDLIWFFNS